MKTNDDIQREKDAVQKMIGTKSAMVTVLDRVERLENALKAIVLHLDDLSPKVGDGLHIKTFYHGSNGSGENIVSVRGQIDRVSGMARKVL